VAALALIRRRVHEVEAHVLGRADEVQMESLAGRRRRDLRADEGARTGEQHGSSGAEPHGCGRRGASGRRQSNAAYCDLLRLRPRLLCMMCSDAPVLTVSPALTEAVDNCVSLSMPVNVSQDRVEHECFEACLLRYPPLHPSSRASAVCDLTATVTRCAP